VYFIIVIFRLINDFTIVFWKFIIGLHSIETTFQSFVAGFGNDCPFNGFLCKLNDNQQASFI